MVVFGSDGGGALFALPAGRVRQFCDCRTGDILDEVYDADSAAPVAANLQDFPTFLRREITNFIGS